MSSRPHRSLRLLVLAAAATALLSAPAPAGATIPCTNGPTFDLKAVSGHIDTPDGNSVFMWGYARAGGSFQMPGPILCVTEGDTVTINLTNNLPEATSIVFPGQTNVAATGAPGLFTAEAAPSGGTATYSFVATQPGTYLYESGTNPHKQVHMGLYGVLIVRPALGTNYAYGDPATKFDPAREYLILLHDIDPALHAAVETGKPYDVTKKHDRYWTINGRSFPDTIAGDFVPWLPSQPYGALVRVQPFDATGNPLPALVRYANAGLANHPLHPHGNHMRVIARDGRLLRGPGGEDTSFEDFTRTIGSGQTYDLLFRWTDVEKWRETSNPVPIQIPSLRNLSFKDAATWYSGSPYLGKTGALPVGTTTYNECGEYYFPWHSHALNEFQNFDEGFGGLSTLLRVDPPGGCGGTPPPPAVSDFTVAASPATASAVQGSNATYTVTVGSVNGFSSAVALSLTGLPSNTTATFAPTSIAGAQGTSTLTIATTYTSTTSTPPGTYTLTIRGQSGSLAHTATVTFTVTANPDPPPPPPPPPPPEVKFPVAAVIEQGTQAGGTLASFTADDADYYQVTSDTGATKKVSWYAIFAGVSNTPPGLGITYKGRNTLPCDQTVSVRNFTQAKWTKLDTRSVGSTDVLERLQVTGVLEEFVSGSAPGTGEVWVQVTCSVVSASTFVSGGNLFSLTLGTLPPVADFSLAVSPASVSVVQGASGSFTAQVGSLNGFAGTVSFATTGLPAGVTPSFTPTTVTGSGSSQLTLAVGAAVPAGSYPFSVVGTSGSLSHSAAGTLQVTAAPPGPVSKVPSSTTIVTGSLASGDAASLAADDANYYNVTSNTGFPRVVTWYGSFTGVAASPASLTARYKGRNSEACTQTLALYRFSTASWVQFDSRSVGTTEQSIQLNPTGTLSDYVGPGGEVRLRVSCSAFSRGSFQSNGNLMTLTYS